MHHQDREVGAQLNAVVAVGYAVERVVHDGREAKLFGNEGAVDGVGCTGQRARAERERIHTRKAVVQTAHVAL